MEEVSRPSMATDVDLILIHRQGTSPADAVLRGIEAQAGVRVSVHRIAGAGRPDDPNRWETIARARNQGRRSGSASLLMFLDDDVVLEPGSVARLVDGLRRRPNHAALACDYLGESGPARRDGRPGHVAMGATLFRRDALSLVRFRWEPGRCECQCCCDDLRRLGLRIEYDADARATHARSPIPRGHAAAGPSIPGRVLAAFDRHHLARFRGRFLASLRAFGNAERVTAIGYGLRPTEVRSLAAEPGVEVVTIPETRVVPAIRRLSDFQGAIRDWPGRTPVAYWDAGDVRFQGRLGGLWERVRAEPGRLLAVEEPVGHPGNFAVREWTLSIADPASRAYAFGLLSTRPFLNSGFAAGTAETMLRYLEAAAKLRDSAAIRGSKDWGDQTALNLYCHADPDRWRPIPEGWNYCLYQRPGRDYRLGTGGLVESSAGVPIHVVHGNGGSFRPFELLYSG